MASENKKLSGAESLRYCIAALTNRSAARLPQVEGINMVPAIRRALKTSGYRLIPERRHVSVDEKHIGLFQEGRAVSAVVMEGNTVVDNPTAFENVNASVLTSRLRVEKASGRSGRS